MTPQLAVHDRGDDVAGAQSVGVREGLEHHDLVVAPSLRKRAALERDRVGRRLARRRQRQEARVRRPIEPLHRQGDLFGDACLRTRHAGKRDDALRERLRRSLERGEDVGEPVPVVVRLARPLERLVGAAQREEARDAGGEDDRDRRDLAEHSPGLAEELAI